MFVAWRMLPRQPENCHTSPAGSAYARSSIHSPRSAEPRRVHSVRSAGIATTTEFVDMPSPSSAKRLIESMPSWRSPNGACSDARACGAAARCLNCSAVRPAFARAAAKGSGSCARRGHARSRAAPSTTRSSPIPQIALNTPASTCAPPHAGPSRTQAPLPRTSGSPASGAARSPRLSHRRSDRSDVSIPARAVPAHSGPLRGPATRGKGRRTAFPQGHHRVGSNTESLGTGVQVARGARLTPHP